MPLLPGSGLVELGVLLPDGLRLGQQGLEFGPGLEELHPRSQAFELSRTVRMPAIGPEVRSDTPAQVDGLAHVEQLSSLVAERVDPSRRV